MPLLKASNARRRGISGLLLQRRLFCAARYFVEEGFQFYFLLGGHQGAELFAALLADLFFLGVGRGVEGFPLGACIVNDRGYLFLLVGVRSTSWVRRDTISSRDFGAV